MPIISFIQRIERMDYLIRTSSTGTPEQFASKLGLSRRSLFLWIEQLREDFSFPIAYDPIRQSYYYTELGSFSFGFVKGKQEEEIVYRDISQVS